MFPIGGGGFQGPLIDQTANRAKATNYVNGGTARFIICNWTASSANSITVAGLTVICNAPTVVCIIPPGATYQVNSDGNLAKWLEMN